MDDRSNEGPQIRKNRRMQEADAHLDEASDLAGAASVAIEKGHDANARQLSLASLAHSNVARAILHFYDLREF